MKKTLTLLAILAAIGPAWGAEVVSSNIVGYEKINLTPGYQMIGVQFLKVGGESLDLATVGTLDASMSGFDEDEIFATELRVWNGNGYNTYGWSGTSGTDVYEDSSYDNLWLYNNTMEAEDGAADASFGFWIKTTETGTMTISGEVPSDDSISVNLVAGMNMIANPFPGSIKIAEFGTLDSSMAGFDEDEIFATEMRVWNGNGYNTYGWSGTSGTDVYEDSSYDNLWLYNNTMEAEDTTLPFGTAVWIKAEKAGTITFTNPAKKQ